jgi:ferric-dicitrate binding protein FerR (iron transport regulator)
MTAQDQWNLSELWEKSRDGRATEAEALRLNSLINEHAEVLPLIARMALMDAQLRDMEEAAFQSKPTSDQVHVKARAWPWHVMTAAAAALVAAGTVWLLKAEPAPVATLVKAQFCKWGNSALPTLEGGLLKPGLLDLVEGMATLQFKSGAEVVMEAPVSLEVLSSMECRVRKGTVVADVPDRAKGFTVYTPETKVIDWGTRFGVSAGDDGKCLVQVIKGLVEVQRKGESKTKELRAGERADYGGFLASAVNPDVDREDEPGRWLPAKIRDLGDGWQAVTTAFGEGRDSWIQSNPNVKVTGQESYLRVKYSTFDGKLDRKAYMAFDISRFKGKRIEEAEFVINVEPSDLGFASLVPDAIFRVYVLTREDQDLWREAELNWSNAPAHNDLPEHRTSAIIGQALYVGSFTIPQGTTRGAFSVKSAAIAEALRSDTNGTLTLILCRETNETDRNGLAHAFASKENQRNSPPTLRIKVAD